MVVATDYKELWATSPWMCLNWTQRWYKAQWPKNRCRNTPTDSGCQLSTQIIVHSRWIWRWAWQRWKSCLLSFLTIYRTLQSESGCSLGGQIIMGRSWTPRWTPTWVSLVLHLGDSNWINLGPPSLLGHPCWTPCPLHEPILVVCIRAMSSSGGIGCVAKEGIV